MRRRAAMFLLDDILLAPVKGLSWLGEQIAKEVNKKFFDEASIKAELEQLQDLSDRGQISQQEFEGREDQLLQRLQKARQMKQG
jgi:hypothetical protein